MAEQSHILGICETWLRPSDLIQSKQFAESVSVLQDHGGWRGQGGVAVIVAPLINYRVVRKHSQVEYQFIILNIAGTYVSVVYIRPHLPKQRFLQCLNHVHDLTRGKSILMGDLNARHTRWDKHTNPHGRWLLEWAQSHRWTIDAPSCPTFASHQGSSTVDLFLSKGVTTSGAEVLNGIWDGSSDHRAVRTRIVARPQYNLDVPRIPQSQRRNPVFVKKAKTLYQSELPRLVKLAQSSSTAQEVEDLYSQLKEVILEPWSSARKHRPKRYKYFWTRRLDYLKSMRSKKYRQAASAPPSAQSELWAQYRAIDHQVRSLTQKHKRQLRNRLSEALASPDPHERSKVMKSVLTTTPQTSSDNSDPALLNLADFTRSIETPPGQGYTPPIVPFDVTPDFERKVFTAINSAKQNRATGTDELFSEAFKLAPLHFAKVFSVLWAKCSHLQYMIRDWRTALLVPIYKHGSKSDPSNYRPIALVSHGRQTISKAIGYLIRAEYTFHPTQLGFRERAGTETALLRHTASTLDGFKYTAVLDLKGAYPSVHRDKLMEKVTARLSPRTAAMIALELQPETILTKGDTSGTTGTVKLGVPQGRSSSPPLYNVEMDSFCELMESKLATLNPDDAVDVSVFADDVKLRARTAQGLQKGLNCCSEWTTQERMSWAIPKCHILQPETMNVSPPSTPYILSGETVGTAASAVYLGVTLTGTRLALDKNVTRVKSAMQRIGMLKAAGIHRKRVPSARLLEICRTYVYPLADYAVHLMPLEPFGTCPLSTHLELLDYRVVEYALGCIPKVPTHRPNRRIGGRLPRHLKIAKIPDWLQRIGMRLCSFKHRLLIRSRRERQDSLACSDPTHLDALRIHHRSPKPMTKKDVRYAWTGLCRRLRRPIPVPESGLLPILYERDARVRDAGIRWLCGSFPGNPTLLQNHFGLALYNQHKVRISRGMQASFWDSRIRRETMASLLAFADVLDGMPSRGTKRGRPPLSGHGRASKALRVSR